MLACRQVHLRFTAPSFRPSLLPSASALQFGNSGKNGNSAKGNSPMPWALYAPIYRRLSVALLFRPFRRSNAPHQRSALTSPICFAEAVKENRRAALEAAEAKQPAELQYGFERALAITCVNSVLLLRFRFRPTWWLNGASSFLLEICKYPRPVKDAALRSCEPKLRTPRIQKRTEEKVIARW